LTARVGEAEYTSKKYYLTGERAARKVI